MAGRALYRYHFALGERKIIYVAEKLLAAVLKSHFHHIKNGLALGQFHIGQPIEYVELVAPPRAASAIVTAALRRPVAYGITSTPACTSLATHCPLLVVSTPL